MKTYEINFLELRCLFMFIVKKYVLFGKYYIYSKTDTEKQILDSRYALRIIYDSMHHLK